MIRFTPIQSIPVGPLHITSHGIFIFLGALAALWWARARTPEEYRETLEGSLPWMTLAGVLGARLGWAVINTDQIVHWWDVIAFWKGGLVSYGGLIAALIAWFVYCRATGLPTRVVTDALAPAGLLGWGIGRIGCFLNWFGEHGKPTSMPWGIVTGAPPNPALYPGWSPDPRHPVMLYQSLLLIGGALLVAYLARRYNRSAAGLSLIVYGLSRFLGDFFRVWDPPSLQMVSQGIALALAAVGIVYLMRVQKTSTSKT